MVKNIKKLREQKVRNKKNDLIKFDDYKNCLLKDKVLLKSQQSFITKKARCIYRGY